MLLAPSTPFLNVSKSRLFILGAISSFSSFTLVFVFCDHAALAAAAVTLVAADAARVLIEHLRIFVFSDKIARKRRAAK